MKTFYLLATVLFVAVLSVNARPNEVEVPHYGDVQTEWENFKKEHKRVYKDDAEESLRFNVFKDNLEKVKAHNTKFTAGEVSWTQGINHFSDKTADELRLKPLPPRSD